MSTLSRRMLLGTALAGSTLAIADRAQALTESLTDIASSLTAPPPATIFTAREIVTLDPGRPGAEAVAVVNGRILWVGDLTEVTDILGDQPYTIDRSFADHVLVPGFVAQHDHPVLAALTMSSEILSIEDWVLPGRTVPAVRDKQDFIERLTRAVNAAPPSVDAILTWGYHAGFFGPLTRTELDAISTTKPIIVWARSCHEYMHAKGITTGNEPGGILAKPVQDGVNAVFSSPDMPFRWSFMVDAKSMVATYPDDGQVITQSQQLASWYGGMTSLAPMQAKLFADGAIYSQLMQVRAPYLDGHKGEWMMDQPAFERGFRIFWDAGYQIHIHVNGDAGLDLVLATLESNLRRNPRYDHRTVLVHFAVSDADQVARIKSLGAIVSGNPYYVAALADQYGKVGLGPERADEMVRLGDLNRNGISWSLHSDMPMAPADPLFLMWCAVNRLTASGRVAAPEQRVTAEQALRGVTIAAAHSLKLEDEIGTIAAGKRANFTVIADNPLTVDPLKIKDVAVWGTVMEGRVLPAPKAQQQKAELPPAPAAAEGAPGFSQAALHHALKMAHAFD